MNSGWQRRQHMQIIVFVITAEQCSIIRQPIMLALKPLPSDLSLRPSPATLAINRRRRIQFPASVRRSVDVKAAVSGGDKSQTTSTTTTSPSLDSKERKGKSSVASSGSGIDEEGIQVKAVVTIRKKMKENITEKLGDQWENMVNGFGQGIQIQLISEEIHPGTSVSQLNSTLFFFFF